MIVLYLNNMNVDALINLERTYDGQILVLTDQSQAIFDAIVRCDMVITDLETYDTDEFAEIRDFCDTYDIPYRIYPDLPEFPEKKYPIEDMEFLATVMNLYRIHSLKNADYGPNNILAFGINGILIRMWDKIARLFNLYGYELETKMISYTMRKEPHYESIEDNFFDFAVYAILGILNLRDKLGK